VTGIRVFAGASGAGGLLAGTEPRPALGGSEPVPAIPGAAPVSLPATLPRELIPAETGALWTLADPLSRQLLVLLLSGLTLEECAALTAGDFDLPAFAVLPPSQPPRLVPLSPHACVLFAASSPLPLWAGDGQAPADLEARIGLLASDAGLTRPQEVTAAVLRHTWLTFLVRQGARLTELERIAGRIPAAELARYQALSPAGPARPLAEVDLVYPLPA
jgi:integrase